GSGGSAADRPHPARAEAERPVDAAGRVEPAFRSFPRRPARPHRRRRGEGEPDGRRGAGAGQGTDRLPERLTFSASDDISRSQEERNMKTSRILIALLCAAPAAFAQKLQLSGDAVKIGLLTNDKCNHNSLRYAYDNYMLANGTGTAVTKQGGKTWYMIYPNYAFGQNLERQMRAAVEKAGGKIVAPSDATPFPNTDFSTFILKAQSLKPQIFGTMQAGADLVNVVKQYNEF